MRVLPPARGVLKLNRLAQLAASPGAASARASADAGASRIGTADLGVAELGLPAAGGALDIGLLAQWRKESAEQRLTFALLGRAPYIQTAGPERGRVLSTALFAARMLEDQGQASRFITYSTASGWRELYARDNSPVAYNGATGCPVPYDALVHAGTPGLHGEAQEPTPRAGYNHPVLLKQLYGAEDAPVDDALEVLKAIQRVAATAQRVVFHVEGLGPTLRRDTDGETATAQMAQQLRDMEAGLIAASTKVIFNDGPGFASAALSKYQVVPFTLELPDEKTLAGATFEELVNAAVNFEGLTPRDLKALAPDDDAAERAALAEITGLLVTKRAIEAARARGLMPEHLAALLPEDADLPGVVQRLKGLTVDQCRNVIADALGRVSDEEPRLPLGFIEHTRATLMMTNGIEQVKIGENLPEPVGLDAVIGHLKRTAAAIKSGKRRARPVRPQKLFLLAGVPGTGKSLVCKHAAKIMGLPLYKISLDALFSKWVGDTEANTRALIAALEALAPAAFMVEEIEKALGGTAEGSTTTHETTNRMHGGLLTFFQDTEAEIAVLGSVNDPSQLSSALIDRAAAYQFGFFTQKTLPAAWLGNLRAAAGPEAVHLTDAEAAELARLWPRATGRTIEKAIVAVREELLVQNPDEEVITFADVKRVMERMTTIDEVDPQRLQTLTRLNKGFQSASGEPLVLPPLPAARAGQALAGAAPVAERLDGPGA